MLAFFSNIFGYVLNAIYEIVKNYGVAIILFSILLKIILLPISIKQQKAMIKTSKMQPKIKDLQNKYKNDPEKMNKEIMDLYKREKMSPFSGCLPSIVQILLLFAMFYLVRSPLTYMKKIDTAAIDNVKKYISQEVGENSISKAYPEISIIKYASKLKNGESVTIETTSENKEENNNVENLEENNNEVATENIEKVVLDEANIEKSYINMNFLGLDLSNVPSENIKNIKKNDLKELTVLIIPLLYVISSIISMKITTNMNKKKQNKKEEIIVQDDKKEIQAKEDVDVSTQMNKSMSLFMPIMSVSISLVAPLGLALYWLLNNILMIVERLVLNKMLHSKEENEDV